MTAGSERDYRFAFYTLAVVLAALALLLNWQGPCFETNWGHDTIGFLNGAWKVRNGILPHTDYHSALGALNPWLLAAGMWLLGPTSAVVPFCVSLVAVGAGVLAFVVARSRLPAWPALAFALTQTLVASSPHLLRYTWDTATYACYYNRQGYALLSALMLLLFLPPRAGLAHHERREGLLVGGLLGFFLFLKVSYFMAAGGLCALAFLFARRSSLAWCVHVLVGFVAVAAACLPLIRFDVLALWRDLHLAAQVRAENPELAEQMTHVLGWKANGWFEISLIGLMTLLLSPPLLFRRRPGEPGAVVPSLASFAFFRRKEAPPSQDWNLVPSWAEFVGIVAINAFICLTNASIDYPSETPLLTSWLFVLLGVALRQPMNSWFGGVVWRLPATTRLALMGGASCLLWIHTFGASLSCLVWSVSPWRTAWQKDALAISPPFESDSLRESRMLLWSGEDHALPVTYAEKVNDGLRLLRALGGTHRVEAFDFANPFPFALQWPAARGGCWVWHLGYSFDEKYHPTPEEAFGDADILMVPKYAGHLNSLRALGRVYGPYVLSHFEQINESRLWFVMRRKY